MAHSPACRVRVAMALLALKSKPTKLMRMAKRRKSGNANVQPVIWGQLVKSPFVKIIPVSMAALAYNFQAAATSAYVLWASMVTTANTVSKTLRKITIHTYMIA